MNMDQMHFTFSDLISGYIDDFDWDKGFVQISTVDGRIFKAKLSDNVYAEMIRNLGEPYMDCTGQMKDMLNDRGRFVFIYGVFYNENKEFSFDAKHIVFVGKEKNEFRFEKQNWWINQIKQLGNFYYKAQFDGMDVDYTKYRTHLTLEGTKMDTTRQETDTISRMIYGFASAYMLTGEDKFLDAAEKGTEYLREHFRAEDKSEDIVYWYHGVDYLGKNNYKKIYASEFGDDYDAIPAYEQIYALAGPTQTYRVTGDKRILKDIDRTLNLFDKYFKDNENGGYWSHIDPITFSGTSESLGQNSDRKNWNSCGDHTPAYLINAYLATRNDRYKEMLKYCADLIINHFPDYDNSPFVEEKFHGDWSRDNTWKWQQNHGVVGHNLKIAWNLMRVQSLISDDSYVELAEKIAGLMPQYGMDKQRCGWYDVVDRVRGENHEFNHFAWHDRKAWWQQEQGILAYYILAGTLKKPEYLKLARESASFYNAWFPDHDSGAVYFNVLSNGLPYLLGTERLKASHSMSGYHSFELAYLCATYSNLLVNNEPMDLYFKPTPSDLENRLLYVQPDILPEGSVKIHQVWINGNPHIDFNADEMWIRLPEGSERVSVKVKVYPIGLKKDFEMTSSFQNGNTKIVMSGIMDSKDVDDFRNMLQGALNSGSNNIDIDMTNLQSISSSSIRAIMFFKAKISGDIRIIGANQSIIDAFKDDEVFEELQFISSSELNFN